MLSVNSIFKAIINLCALRTDKKQLIILSDDWGSVRIKSKQDQEALVKKGLIINNRFDQYDSLETNEDLELLFEVLTKHKDHLGNHPVITAVTNVGNPDFEKIAASNFTNYAYERIDQTYKRYPNSNRVLSLIKQGISQKIFIPQSHGREHVQVNWWMHELQHENSYATRFFEHEFFFLGPNFIKKPKRGRGVGAAFDVWELKDLETQKEIIHTGLNEFEKLFGYSTKIFTPPAMFYHPSIEKQLSFEGIEWLDVGRLFKTPQVGGGEKWQINYHGRKKNSGIKVMVRNGMFEPNISDTNNGVNRALFDIEQAFNAKQPALLSNHRAAFVGRIDKRNRDKGIAALDELLTKALRKWPEIEFVSASSV